MEALQINLSLEAGTRVHHLSTALFGLYKDSSTELVNASLNKLCVHVVFCWFSDCAGLFAGKHRFGYYLASLSTSCWHWALQSLFVALDSPASQRVQEKIAILAQLYDPTQMPLALRQAHAANDRLVMQAYGFNPSWSEAQIFSTLYRMYLQLVNAD